jgi:hypothetical protein
LTFGSAKGMIEFDVGFVLIDETDAGEKDDNGGNDG